ncbi:MAG TPA: MlaD family protein [Anaeromyxobacteraceae bacterium]|nr:MlaD family protein [Anaeromyxobacteraceae bacterium]
MPSAILTKALANKALAVGVLVAMAGGAFLVGYTFFRKGGLSERDSYAVHASFDDITGITWKSRVQIAGIPIGEVEKVTLVGGDKARLDLRISRDVVLHSDACLTKRFPSALLPDALLEASSGSPAKPRLRDLPEEEREITCVREAASAAKLLESLAKVAADIQVVTGDLARTVGGPEGSMRDIIQNLAHVSRTIDEVVGQNAGKMSRTLSNAEAFSLTIREVAETDRERYHAIARNVAEASERLNQVLKSVQQIVGGQEPQLKESVEGVRQALDKINRSLDQIEQTVDAVAQGKGVAGKLLADEQLGQKLATAIEQYTDYADRLYKLQVQIQLRSEWLLNESGAKTYAGIRFIPRPDKYYLLEFVSDPRGVNTVTTETVTTLNQTTGQQVTTVSTRALNQQKLTVSAEFAKRFGWATFRIGIIESSGGVGSDVHFFDDALQISVDLYQFTRATQDVFPRAKLWANWYFLDHFYVTAGTDDFLNKWRGGAYPGGPRFSIGRDVFMGGGFFFTDQDLKTLFGGLGAATTSLP